MQIETNMSQTISTLETSKSLALLESKFTLETSSASLKFKSVGPLQVHLNISEDADRPMFKNIPRRQPGIQKGLVQPGDYIYYHSVESWDSSPIVIESHKLIFFTIPKVGCTVWKQLFRRMMNKTDWKSQDSGLVLPHNPDTNGLKYLYHYPVEEASVMMSSNEWTRAIMVRDPKERFLSAFLDKAVANDHRHIHDRCCPDNSCVHGAQTISGFVDLCYRCYDDHWRPQNDRMDTKYWPYIDVVLNIDSAAAGAKKLLKRINAWEEYGKTGWGQKGSLSIFGTTEIDGSGVHSKFAKWEIWKWYTPPTEKLVENFYQGDYENPLLNFTSGSCLTC